MRMQNAIYSCTVFSLSSLQLIRKDRIQSTSFQCKAYERTMCDMIVLPHKACTFYFSKGKRDFALESISNQPNQLMEDSRLLLKEITLFFLILIILLGG